MSDSVWPHRWQPTRLPCPWDSSGKNTGVSCHFLFQCVKVKSLSRVLATTIYIQSPIPGFPMMCTFCWRRQWHPTPVLLPGKSHGHGQRTLVGFSPWGCEESDTTEWIHFHFLLSCIGEGNGNPLQYSCLKNPRDRGAWWAAVYGVAESQTRLKWLSSSSRLTIRK